jgi:hypothetical protein
MALTCTECGEEFPEYLRNALRAQGMREAVLMWHLNKQAILDRIKELEGPHGEFLTK